MLDVASFACAAEVFESDRLRKVTIMKTEWTENGPEIDVVDRQASVTLVVDDIVNQRDMAFRMLIQVLLKAIDPRQTA
jgi:hypothetical protein